MNYLPIFQMVVEIDNNENRTLKFSSEIDEYSFPFYVIPASYNGSRWWNFQFYLDGELDSQPHRFIFNVKDDKLVLVDKRIETVVELQMDKQRELLHQCSKDGRFTRTLTLLTYKGDYSAFIFPFSEFVVLRPTSIDVMNKLYKERKTCFVGTTPIYGEYEPKNYG